MDRRNNKIRAAIMLNRIKSLSNYLIVFLCVLTIYQTARLWLEDYTGRDLLSLFTSTLPNAVSYSTDQLNIATPFRIIYNLENGISKVLYNKLLSNPDKKSCDALLKEVMQKGDFVTSYPRKEAELGTLTFDYNYSLPADVFVKIYGQKGNMLTSRIKGFNRIVFVPDEGKLRVVFSDEDTDYEYVLAKKSLEFKQNFNYETVNYVFDEGIYQPAWDGKFTYPTVSVSNPYTLRGELLLNTVEKNIDVFFDNAYNKWTGIVNDVYTYSDETRVVKYYKNNICEYFNYSTKKQSPDLLADYATALKFISIDTSVSNEFFLTGFESNEEKTVFLFDYIINNFPLAFSETLKADTGIEHAIMVTVENGQVVHYKKLAYNFTVDLDLRMDASVSFRQAMESMYNMGMLPIVEPTSEDIEELPQISDVSLCYRIDTDRQILLYWFLKFGDRTFVTGTQNR